MLKQKIPFHFSSFISLAASEVDHHFRIATFQHQVENEENWFLVKIYSLTCIETRLYIMGKIYPNNNKISQDAPHPLI